MIFSENRYTLFWIMRWSSGMQVRQFAALDVASGFIIGKCYKRHRAVEFLKFSQRDRRSNP
jgi:hypothetical protein